MTSNQPAIRTAFEDRLEAGIARVDACLDDVLPAASRLPNRLHEAMRYAVFNGGKRLRPLLVYASGDCVGFSADALDAAAVAIELIHAFSLVHDDLPAMDDDHLRRGKPTVHIRFDEATAILAADALQPLAFSVLAAMPDTTAVVRTRLVQKLSDACGSLGMTGGQALDLAAEGGSLSVAELEHMYALKTGALIHISVIAPTILADGLSDSDRRALDRFGNDIGIAFQIKDDILDVEGATDVIGKPAGSDESSNKATYPALFGMERSRDRCDELLDGALQALDRFGNAADSLTALARYIVDRGR